MKKLLFVLAVSVILAFAACGQKESTTTTANDSTNVVADTTTIVFDTTSVK